ncbi:hypothetical protein [Pseudomonas chlororaphis]|uniref:hypothetical protein n=1 Tax=Pseudomonas chlororaphis TaxID=587753 RepID=UPI000F589B85|nr:hypothetical protein [Pseudomonas chlororaphis]AZD22385.1 hypothetical protein C4K24_3082 [Pseudomonas chlororaphis subsp. aurantiaca]
MLPTPTPLPCETSTEDPVASLRDLLERSRTPPRQELEATPSPISERPRSLLGEVIDTHHPELPGYVFVRWSAGSEQVARWLECVRTVVPQRGDRVLLEQPANWPEALVVATLEPPYPGAIQPPPSEASQTVTVPSGQCVRIADARGNPLIEVQGSSRGPVVRLIGDDVDLQVDGKLRLRAEAIELRGGRGGVDIRTDAETVVRGRFIRLN